MRTRLALSPGKRLRVAGLMSGTSADGVDAAIVDIRGREVEVVAFGTKRYPAAVRSAVLKISHARTALVDDICRLNYALGEAFADALITLCGKRRIPLKSIDLVGSHGQTVRHLPHRGKAAGSTLQVGEAAVIAARTGIRTVADFRAADVAAGGEGAPLVPFVDWLLFSDKRLSRAVQNIGGIANVTYLAAGGEREQVVAFDTGPGNMLIDAVVALATGGKKNFDRNGSIARRGRIDVRLLARLMRHPFLSRKPPKSTGREQFGLRFAQRIWKRAAKRGLRGEDVVATATAFTAETIAQAYRHFLPGRLDEVILSGGGARNPVLVNMVAERLAPARVRLSDEFGLDADAKEAVAFALLAAANISGIPAGMASVTGARRSAILGKVIPV